MPSPDSTLQQLLEDAATSHPNHIFLKDRQRALTYADTLAEVRALAAFLQREGLRPCERVAIHLSNRAEVAVALFAVAAAGGIFVVMNDKLRAKGVAKILNQAEPRAIICDRETIEAAPESGDARLTRIFVGEGEPPAGWTSWTAATSMETSELSNPLDAEATACLVFTSGSTAAPRGVELSHANIRFVVRAIQARLGYRAEDTIGCFLPLAFDYGLYQIFLAAEAGATLFIGDPGQVGPKLPEILAKQEVSVLPGVPAVYAALIMLGKRRPFELPRLRAITNTGERLPLAYIESLRAMFPGLEVFVMYGLTECKRVSILLPGEFDHKRDSVGRPLDGTEVHAADEDGARLQPGIPGELVVRGPHVAKGYWRAPEETAKRYRRFEENGDAGIELFTGDRGWVDEEGFLYFAARADDMIKYRGNRISPVEIENEACAIAAVGEAAALKRERDETLHLFVSTDDDGLTSNAVLNALSEALEPAKIPEIVHIGSSLPKSVNGKIDRNALQQLLDSEEP